MITADEARNIPTKADREVLEEIVTKIFEQAELQRRNLEYTIPAKANVKVIKTALIQAGYKVNEVASTQYVSRIILIDWTK